MNRIKCECEASHNFNYIYVSGFTVDDKKSGIRQHCEKCVRAQKDED